MYNEYILNSNVTNMLSYLEKVEGLHKNLLNKDRDQIDHLLGEAYLLMFDNVKGKLQPIKYKKSRDLIMRDLDKIHYNKDIPITGTSMLYKAEPLVANWVTNGYYHGKINIG